MITWINETKDGKVKLSKAVINCLEVYLSYLPRMEDRIYLNVYLMIDQVPMTKIIDTVHFGNGAIDQAIKKQALQIIANRFRILANSLQWSVDIIDGEIKKG